MQFPHVSCQFIPLQSKYPPQHPVLKHTQSMSLNVRDQVSYPYRTTSRIIVLYILISTFSIAGEKTECSGPNGSKYYQNSISS
jgi:hypothetical protein